MFHLRMTGCNDHVLASQCCVRTWLSSCAQVSQRNLTYRPHVDIPRETKCFKKASNFKVKWKSWFCGIYSYLESRVKRAGISSLVIERTTKATSVSQKTVARIQQKQKRLYDGDHFAQPAKRYRRSRRRIISDREAIWWHIYCLYEQKVNITLDRLLVRLLLWFIFNA